MQLGISPILYLAFVEGGEQEIHSIEDLSQAIHRIKPSLGTPGRIRQNIIRGIKQRWQRLVSSALAQNPALTDDDLLKLVMREIEGSLPRSGYRAFNYSEVRIMNFYGSDLTRSYQFSISGEGAQRTLNLTITRTPTEFQNLNPWAGRSRVYSDFPWDDFIERYFSREGMVQHSMREATIETRSLGVDLMQYLHRMNILSGLTDDDVLRFIARGDAALFKTLSMTYGMGGEEALRAAIEATERGALRRGTRGWLVLGGIALGVGAVIAWVTGPSDLEKFLKYFADKNPGTDEDPVSLKVLQQIVEIDDRNTLVETLNGLGCHNTHVLWNAVFHAAEYPTD